MRDNCTECSEVGAMLNRSTHGVCTTANRQQDHVRGNTWTMLSLNNIEIAIGRGFTPADEDHATHK